MSRRDAELMRIFAKIEVRDFRLDKIGSAAMKAQVSLDKDPPDLQAVADNLAFIEGLTEGRG